ncbi:MAG: phosphate ABC transporter substrate-binding protein [Desulfuromonadales bacterium]|nr:phosphate ABC transporter substrate-binding protein [Desulfuromonadales bacterium]
MSVVRFFLACLVLLIVVPGPLLAESNLRYAGATTLQRYFMPEAVRVFSEQFDVRFTIEGGNTGPGLAALIKGNIDLAGAGRALTAEEKAAGLVEHFLGWDVLAVVLNRTNPVSDLSREQLQAIFSGGISNWQEVGGVEQPVIVITNPKGSGMRAAVKQLILGDKDYLDLEVVSAIVAESDSKVAMFANGITALSMSMVDDDKVKTIRVDDVEPTAETLAAGRYSLAKPLYLVTMGPPQGLLADFVRLATGHQGQEILARHFVPAAR